MESAPKKTPFFAKPWVQSLVGILVIVVFLAGGLFLKSVSSYVSIEKSEVQAPVINISPEAEGILSEVYVHAGDMVVANQTLARVGSEMLSAKTAGLVISVQNTPGQVFVPGSPVVSMIDPAQLRIVGTIDEDKGLSRIAVGDTATFTVDAFGSKTFTGIVEEVSHTSDQSGIAFSISDKRATKQFTVKVRFDVSAHPEFKNGMSARLKVYPK